MGELRARLIEEVKRFPSLYDPSHESHSNAQARDQCWMQIAQRLGADCEVLKREWKILRDSLRQALKRSSRASRHGTGTGGAGTGTGSAPRRWRYERQMAYLFPYLTERVRGSRNKPVSVARAPSSPSPASPEPAAADLDSSWAPSEQGATGVTEQADALELFFASVCQSTRRLPRRYQNHIKRRVLELVLQAEEELDAEGADPHYESKAF